MSMHLFSSIDLNIGLLECFSVTRSRFVKCSKVVVTFKARNDKNFFVIGCFVEKMIKGSHCGGIEDVAYATHRRRRMSQATIY